MDLVDLLRVYRISTTKNAQVMMPIRKTVVPQLSACGVASKLCASAALCVACVCVHCGYASAVQAAAGGGAAACLWGNVSDVCVNDRDVKRQR